MKKYLAIISAMVFLVTGVTGCSAAPAEQAPQNGFTLSMQIGNPLMTINGLDKEIDPGRGTAPVLQSDRTLLPVRAVVEEMGGAAAWDEETQTVVLALRDDIILLCAGSQTAYLNETAHTLDAVPAVIDGRTMLPVRFIAESFGFTVAWDEENARVTISEPAGNRAGPVRVQ